MSSRKGLYILSIAMLVALLPATLAGAAPLSQGDETIIMASDNPMGNVTPFYFETWVGGEMGPYVYDSLFLRTPDLRLIPGLATGYTVSDDGLTYTVTLREDVQWHDGEPFDAEDIVSSYKWMSGMGGTRGVSLRGLITDTITAISPYEVQFELEETNPFFVDRALSIEVIPQHVWKEIFDNPDLEIPEGMTIYDVAHDFEANVGTGPYKFVEMERDQTYRFTRNDDYWGPKPVPKDLIVTVIKDRTVMMQALSAGEVDVSLISVEPSTVEQFEQDPAIDIMRGPDMANYSLFINVERPSLSDKVVRQAIARAIDIDKLVELITLGTGTKLTAGYPHPDLWWAPEGLYHEYNPDLANQMLDDAGYARGDDGIRVTPDGEKMSYQLIADANSPTEVRSAELIGGMLAEIGIEAVPDAMDIESGVEKVWPEYNAANGRDYDLSMWLWSNYPMINRWATPMLYDPRFDSVGWANISGYVNPEVEPLVDTFLSSPDQEEQRAAELKLFDLIAEDVPFVPLFAPGGAFAFRNEKYTDYQYKMGVGIHNRWTFLPESAWKDVATIAAGEAVAEPVLQATDTPLPPTEAPAPTQAPQPTSPPAPEPEPEQAGAGIDWTLIVVVVVVIAILVAAFLLLRRRA